MVSAIFVIRGDRRRDGWRREREGERLPIASVRKAKPRIMPMYPMRGRIHILISMLGGKDWACSIGER